jgi:hypothetical protein
VLQTCGRLTRDGGDAPTSRSPFRTRRCEISVGPEAPLDLIGEAMQQGIAGEGGGRGPIRAGGVENQAPAEEEAPEPSGPDRG